MKLTVLLHFIDLLFFSATADFPKFLGIAMETLITMCDDADVDVRIVADECLNKLIRVRTVILFININL